MKYNGDPYDDAFTAAREANETGRVVKMNGINWHPNKPERPLEKIGVILLAFAGMVICAFFSAAFYVLIRMWLS